MCITYAKIHPHGEKGILRYRGIPIEELVKTEAFVKVAYLLVHGTLPDEEQSRLFSERITSRASLPVFTIVS